MQVSLGEEEDTPGIWVHRGTSVWGHSERIAGCKPRMEASGEVKPAGVLILDFQSQIWENKLLMFKPLGLPKQTDTGGQAIVSAVFIT